MYFFNKIVKPYSTGTLLRTLSFSNGRSNGRITVRSRRSGDAACNEFDMSLNNHHFERVGQVVALISRKWRAKKSAISIEGGFLNFSLAFDGIKVGQFVAASRKPLPPRVGFSMPIAFIPVGFKVFNVNGFARSCGVFAQILRRRKQFVLLKLPSSKQKWVNSSSIGTIGQVSNIQRKFVKMIHASSSFFRGRRSHTRGTAMNPVDHPHGGGQGKTSGGRTSVSPYGILTKGYKTVRTLIKRRVSKKLSK